VSLVVMPMNELATVTAVKTGNLDAQISKLADLAGLSELKRAALVRREDSSASGVFQRALRRLFR
jgi:hypothetical protein